MLLTPAAPAPGAIVPHPSRIATNIATNTACATTDPVIRDEEQGSCEAPIDLLVGGFCPDGEACASADSAGP
jgi:hypothetical protein